MSQPFSRSDLANAGCGMPNCTHDHSVLHLHPRCHMGKGLDVSYEKARGVLVVRCHKCTQLVGEYLVGDRQ